jgi:uncharacterized protein (DUF427 family)
MLGATTVVDSRSPVLVWEPGVAVPLYAFPEVDLRTDLLRPSPAAPDDPHPGATGHFDLVVDGLVMPHAAWRLPGPDLDGHLGFEWVERVGRGLDRWFEEDEPIVVHPRDPYVRVDALLSSRQVVVRVGGEVVARTRSPVLVFETGLPTRYYVPPADVAWERFEASELRTGCPYKGVAQYWSWRASPGAAPVRNVAWSYPAPLPAVTAIRDLVAFYPDRAAIEVD